MSLIRRWGVIASAALSVTLVASAAAPAQTPTQPADTASRPTVSSPHWGQNNGPNGALTPSGIQTFDEPTKLVAQTVMAVPQAAADYTVAKWTYRRINSDLNRATNFARDDFHNSSEYANANAELQAAYAEYAAAREDAVKSVRQTDDYRAAEELRASLTERIADVAGSTPDGQRPDLDQLAAMAALKIDYISPMRSVERELINASPAVGRARTRLQNAAREVARLEKSFARQARDSIELADLRKGRETARIAYLASFAYLDEARLARDGAVTFALLTRGFRYDNNGVLYNPNTGGYRVGGYDYGGSYSGGYGGYGYGGFGYGGFGMAYGGLGRVGAAGRLGYGETIRGPGLGVGYVGPNFRGPGMGTNNVGAGARGTGLGVYSGGPTNVN